jgi:hypothetical protein
VGEFLALGYGETRRPLDATLKWRKWLRTEIRLRAGKVNRIRTDGGSGRRGIDWRMRRPRFLAPERKRRTQIRDIREETTETIFGIREEAADAERIGERDGADQRERRGGGVRPRFMAPERHGATDRARDGRVRGLAEPCAIVLWTPTLCS